MQFSENNITVKFQDDRTTECSILTKVRDLLPGHADEGKHILGALVNNDVVSLSYQLEVDSEISFLTLEDSQGWRVYRQSVAFLLSKAVRDIFQDSKLRIEHSLGTGFYCYLEMDGQGEVSAGQLEQIEERMYELVKEALPIERRKIFFSNAIDYFEEQGMWDKCNLLKFHNPPKVSVHCCGEFLDLAHGPLVDTTAALTLFKLLPYAPGFVLQFPEREGPPHLAPFEKQPHLFNIFKSYKRWGRVVGVRTAGDLNEIIARGEFNEFIKISEAYQEKRIAKIADEICARRDQTRWILMAGPSSSGKTTFCKRLAVQMKVNGMHPVMISVDDYFVDRELTPRDEHGELNFEHIETLDLELLHEHLYRLDQREEVELPRFNFSLGKREYRGDKLRIGDNEVVLVEGIHSLNPRLSSPLPAEHKFKIYLSALTQLNLDYDNRISTTDNRLVRRMVRDNQFRGNPALGTLEMWPSVRRGEKLWVFPFQKEADVAFNSALDYELPVLKPIVEPLLAQVKPMHPQYANARRLQHFLSSFISASSSSVPSTSLLREFIGDSGFHY